MKGCLFCLGVMAVSLLGNRSSPADDAKPAPSAESPTAPVISLQPSSDESPQPVVVGVRRDPAYAGDRNPDELVDFTLTDQLGRPVTKQSLLGTPWVANFIFSTCPSHCPATLNEIFHLQRRLEKTDVKFVTVTVDPQTDTVEKLAELAKAFSADPDRWLFLTGEPAQLQNLIMRGFLQPMESSPMRLAHSLKLMHVDATGKVVGQYHYDYQKPKDGESEVAKLRQVLEGKIETPPGNRFMPALALNDLDQTPTSTDTASDTESAAAVPVQDVGGESVVPAWVERLRTMNAVLNGIATILLLVGHRFIRKGHVELHKRTMLLAFGTSVAFLVSYLTYHGALKHFTGVGHKPYAGLEALLWPYRVILVTHIALAALVPVLAIITIVRGLTGQIERHRRIAKVTYPIWLYVSVTGVIIYFMNA